MSTAHLAVLPEPLPSVPPVVDVVVPAYNEAPTLEDSVQRLHLYLSTRFPMSWRITIAENGSTDATWTVARRLSRTREGVEAIHVDAKGRGRALRAAWSASASPVVAYMDADLSTDLNALLPLVAPLLSRHSDIAIGTRLARGSRVVRARKREVISRGYNLLLKATLHNKFSDAQCGFKAVRSDVVRRLLPLVEDDGWFFDTELLILAERCGLRIHEVPVDWVDDPDSRVDVASTARGDLRGIAHDAAVVEADGGSAVVSVITLAPPEPEHAQEPVEVEPERSDRNWERIGLVALLAGTALLYLWGLSGSGWANSFYTAAVQAGTKSWKAFFFGSSDAASFITVDKPPAALWVMGISARLFGVNSWSILVPQALEGVAAVGVLYAAVRRWFGAGAGLIAGAVLALTPAAAIMFRFNNPDALLTLLLVCAAYATMRALERGSTLWLVTAGACIGSGFLTKMLQAWVIVPGFTLVYLVAANTTLRRRIWQLALAAMAVLVSSLWWVVVVMAIPASSRPYIGGSQTNSLWDLIFGYNGFGRLTGNETGSVGGGGQPGGMWGPTGWTRMLNDAFGGQIAWLLPASLIFLVALLAFTWRAPRTDRTRGAALLWGSWLVVTGAVFSLSQGIIHPYYTVALAPAIGALVGIGAAFMWRRRHHPACRAVLVAALGATAVCAFELLQRTPDWQPWLAPAILIGALMVSCALLVGPWLSGTAGRVIAVLGLVVALAGSASYAFATAATDHSGAIPSAGPAVAASLGRFGGFGLPGARTRAGGFPRGAPGGFPGGGAGGGAGGAGGLLTGSTPTSELTQLLRQDADSYTWVAATIGSNTASGYQLATGDAVMSIGGFNGTDPAPTLAQFRAYVAAGRIHYYIATGGRGGGFGGRAFGQGGTGSTSSQITSWVESNFKATTVGGITIYDLTS